MRFNIQAIHAACHHKKTAAERKYIIKLNDMAKQEGWKRGLEEFDKLMIQLDPTWGENKVKKMVQERRQGLKLAA